MARSARKGEGAPLAGSNDGLEIELKFELSPRDLRALWRDGAFKALAGDAPSRQSLRATYFDTPDLKLSARGISLRVRKEGRRHVQCVKAQMEFSQAEFAQAGGFARREWESPVKGGALDVSVFKDDAALKALFKGVPVKKLQPIFTTAIQRQSRVLTTPGGARVRCDVDRGRIVCGQGADARETPIHELELELVSGSVSELLNLARLVSAAVPARLSTRTKAQRGFTLHLNQGQPWVRGEAVALPKSPRAEDVLSAAMTQGLKHLIGNEDCVLTHCDAEGVHQMRVAMRRMRSLLTTLKKQFVPGVHEDLARALEAAAGALGPARDWDVFIDELLAPVATALADAPEDLARLETLRGRAERRRQDGYRQAEALIASPDYARLLTDVLCWIGARAWRGGKGDSALDKPARGVAAEVLARRHAHLLKAGKGLAKQSAAARHRLRIAGKKARYAAEFFAPVYGPKKARAYIEALRALQDELGHLNDLAMAQRLMGELIQAARGAKARDLAHAAGLVEGWYAKAQTEREKNLAKTWKAFTKAKAFW